MKSKKKKSQLEDNKEVDYFIDRLANIMFMQVEEEAIKKQEARKRKKKSETKSK